MTVETVDWLTHAAVAAGSPMVLNDRVGTIHFQIHPDNSVEVELQVVLMPRGVYALYISVKTPAITDGQREHLAALVRNGVTFIDMGKYAWLTPAHAPGTAVLKKSADWLATKIGEFLSNATELAHASAIYRL